MFKSVNRRGMLVGLSASVIASGFPGMQTASAAPDSPTEKLVYDAANRLLDVFRNGAHRHEIADTLDKYVAIGAMALFVLGKHRRKLKPDQQQTYIELFNRMVLNVLTRIGNKVRGDAFVVTGSRGNIVAGYVQHDQDRRTALEFRTKQGRITDIRVEGIWMAFLLRQNFDQLIGQGDNIDAVFSFLKSDKGPL